MRRACNLMSGPLQHELEGEDVIGQRGVRGWPRLEMGALWVEAVETRQTQSPVQPPRPPASQYLCPGHLPPNAEMRIDTAQRCRWPHCRCGAPRGRGPEGLGGGVQGPTYGPGTTSGAVPGGGGGGFWGWKSFGTPKFWCPVYSCGNHSPWDTQWTLPLAVCVQLGTLISAVGNPAPTEAFGPRGVHLRGHFQAIA